MFYAKPTQLITLLLLSLMLSTPVLAKDVALEQASVTAARQDYDNAKTAYDDVSYAVNAQEGRIKDEQARLKTLQDEQAAAKVKLANTKAVLEKKQKILDRVWNSSK
jgi:predicted  nucleic acid-binding Zn-ribbon protein